MQILTKVKLYIVSHKVLSIIALIIIIGVGYFIYKKSTSTAGEISYVTTTVQKGTIIATTTGSGQVSASNQIDIQPKVSGQITWVGVVAGQHVSAGQALVSIDATDAQKAVRDAEANLEGAQLDLQTTQVQNTNDDDSQQTAVQNAYQSLLNSSLAATSDDVDATSNVTAPSITGNYTKNVEATITIKVYQSESGTSFEANDGSTGATIGSGIVSTTIPEPIGDTGLYIKFANTQSSQPLWTIAIPNTAAPDYLSNYNAYQDALKNQEENSTTSTITQLDIQTKELAVTKAQNALQDAKDALADYTVRAPFDGVIAVLDAKLGDMASSTAVATIVTTHQLADISLNEVDVAKIALGDKATLTFDAVDGLSIAGVVNEIDTVGTVTQGVVNYAVQIGFDTQDPRIKPGMSVGAAIITDVETDALLVPNGAVKTKNGSSYVQVFTPPLGAASENGQGIISAITPGQVPVTIGLSNDTSTEITSGVNEGDQVVLRAITITATTAAPTTTPSLLGAIGGTRAGATGGGATRGTFRGN